MAKTAKIEVKNQDLLASLRSLLKSVLEMEDVSAMLIPQHLPMKNVVMPVLVNDPEYLDDADPLAPAFPMNAAKIVSRLTRKPMGGKVVAVLRPCEIRAFVELVKLRQARTEELIIIGTDCLGTYNNKDYFRFLEKKGTESTALFYRNVLSGKGAAMEDIDLSPACKSCEFPIPVAADMLIGLVGVDTEKHFMVQSLTPRGEALFNNLNLSEAEEPSARKAAVQSLIAERVAYRDKMFAETAEATNSVEKLTTYLANCVNCYNCRVACPVCYCKECVFVTDVFNHEPSQYLKWAARKGAIKMPTDTVFYHITRLAHMSTACVGCGQCSNACPNDIPVMELFRTVSHQTQKAFNYEPGRSLDEEAPLSVFREAEFEEVVGIN
ncbi:Coenzyme F420 hydrogenase/dehydrogenase, beta subunit C-terminal domain [Desulfonema magnum]|uniref:Formate dehydrogenase family protein n=1 Tax=Desulfonema magnum TaxID=45655 RepID=A0A975BHH9_9BACT|nr:Coenzyme F420 hydrogenase/dehydrogenase, beta subunit C-terminal domain [Desulfonema magnum]QTA85135.1 Formate dehydrogenase family protein [Desulfonema magnum]